MEEMMNILDEVDILLCLCLCLDMDLGSDFEFLDLCSCFWPCAYVEIRVCVLGFVLLCF